MQRMPTRNLPPRSAEQAADDSPMLKMARRIRSEQGTEQVRAFLAAMTPFSAPNEIRRIGEDFGISFESIERESTRQAPMPRPRQQQSGPNQMMDQLNQLKMLMQRSVMMKNGGDPSALLNLLGGR